MIEEKIREILDKWLTDDLRFKTVGNLMACHKELAELFQFEGMLNLINEQRKEIAELKGRKREMACPCRIGKGPCKCIPASGG